MKVLRVFLPAMLAVAIGGAYATPQAEHAAPVAQSAVPSPVAQTAPRPIELTILHVNDTHSKLEPTVTALRMDISESLKAKAVYAELGGFPRLWTALESLRSTTPNALFLHAGDAFQGTLYFTQFLGRADVDFLNALEVGAMVLGNHEFDKGPGLVRTALVEAARFDVLNANASFSQEPELKDSRVLPYTLATVDGEKVAILGLTTTATPYISSPGPNISFADPAATVTGTVGRLEAQGVNKIVVLSHLGYDVDLALARATRGVDVIVGGHSHSLLGDTSAFGLSSRGDYPTVVKSAGDETVLVVQAWEWAKVLGTLTVRFDAEGRVTSWDGTPRLLVGEMWFRIYDLPGAEGKPVRVEFRKTESGWQVKEYDGRAYVVDPPPDRSATHLQALAALQAKTASDPRVMMVADDPRGAVMLAGYAEGVNALKAVIACEALEELWRGNNRGPGPVIADAMLWKTGADIAVMNPGGVRTNLNPGPVSVAQVYELQPFGNTLVTLTVPGSDVLRILEDMTDYTITAYTDKTPQTALIYVAGVRFVLDVKAARGSRVREVNVGTAGTYAPLDPSKTYTVVVNSFMATGGDKNDTLKALAALQYDTGFVDSEATLEYLQGKSLSNVSETRVRQIF